jgi:hypothetical protein
MSSVYLVLTRIKNQWPYMGGTSDLFLEQLEKYHDAEDVRDWYISYFAANKFPRCELESVLDVLGAEIEEKEILVSVTDMFNMSQERTDELALQEVAASYQRSMEVISTFTLYSSIYPILHSRIRDTGFRNALVELYNDVSFRMNAPRSEEGAEVLEARRRFYFDFYLPLQMHFISRKENFSISSDFETDFVELYLIRLSGEELRKRTWGPLRSMDISSANEVFCDVLDRMAGTHEAVCKVLNFLFNERY